MGFYQLQLDLQIIHVEIVIQIVDFGGFDYYRLTKAQLNNCWLSCQFVSRVLHVQSDTITKRRFPIRIKFKMILP